jgi:hypothetical protein
MNESDTNDWVVPERVHAHAREVWGHIKEQRETAERDAQSDGDEETGEESAELLPVAETSAQSTDEPARVEPAPDPEAVVFEAESGVSPQEPSVWDIPGVPEGFDPDAATEAESEYDGAFSYAAEYHAFALGFFQGFHKLSPVPDSDNPDVKREPHYYRGAYMIGYALKTGTLYTFGELGGIW